MCASRLTADVGDVEREPLELAHAPTTPLGYRRIGVDLDFMRFRPASSTARDDAAAEHDSTKRMELEITARAMPVT